MKKKYEDGGYAEFNPGDTSSKSKKKELEVISAGIPEWLTTAISGPASKSTMYITKNLLKKNKALRELFKNKKHKYFETSDGYYINKKDYYSGKTKPIISSDKLKDLKKYDDGGTVHLRDTRQVLDPSSLEEAAHKRIPGGSVARYTAQTQGGDERHLARYIPGEGGKTKRRQVATEGIREAIRNNPDYSDTLSLQTAKEFMEGKPPTKRELLELIMKLFGG